MDKGSFGSSKFLTYLTDKLVAFSYFINSLKAAFGITYYFKKTLTTRVDGGFSFPYIVPELSTANLVQGKRYLCIWNLAWVANYNGFLGIIDGAIINGSQSIRINDVMYTVNQGLTKSKHIVFEFTAESTALYFRVDSMRRNETDNAGTYLVENQCSLTITELPNHVEKPQLG